MQKIHLLDGLSHQMVQQMLIISKLALGADILDNLNFTLNYGKIKSKDTVKTVLHTNLENYKAEEVYGQLTYKVFLKT